MCLPSCADLKIGLGGYYCEHNHQHHLLTKKEVFDVICTYKEKIKKCECCRGEIEPGCSCFCMSCANAIDEAG